MSDRPFRSGMLVFPNLGAAGLLRGRRAGTHWMSRGLLAAFGAVPVAERIAAALSGQP